MKEEFKRFVRIFWLGYLLLYRPREAHDLMGLIRGPDFPWRGRRLKKFFTKRVRGFFFPSDPIVDLTRNTPLVRSDAYDLYDELKNLAAEVWAGKISSSEIKHYLDHAVHTTKVLLRLPLQTEEEKKELRALYKLAQLLHGGGPHFGRLTEKRLLRWFDEHFSQPSIR